MMTSTTYIDGSKPNRVQTGGERTIAYRTNDSWAKSAKQAGKVVDLKKDVLCVEYADGTTENIPLGRHFGTWSGHTLPYDNTTQLKVGDQFTVDDILVYNKQYFAPDPLNKNRVLFKRGIIGKIVLWEDVNTLEDASTVSRAFTERLGTAVTHKRYVKIPFDHVVEQLVFEGQMVTSESILCNLRPPLSGLGNRYSDDAKHALDVLSTAVPTAKHDGRVDRIEVLYSGDIENMSESLQEIVSKSDAQLYRRNKLIGSPVKSAYVDPSYRIENVDVGADQVVMCYYITEQMGASIGDKLVWGHQLKSIISAVIDDPHVAEDGTVIDAAFGRNSISARIVNSMDLVSTTNTVLSLIEKEMLDAYFSLQPKNGG